MYVSAVSSRLSPTPTLPKPTCPRFPRIIIDHYSFESPSRIHMRLEPSYSVSTILLHIAKLGKDNPQAHISGSVKRDRHQLLLSSLRDVGLLGAFVGCGLMGRSRPSDRTVRPGGVAWHVSEIGDGQFYVMFIFIYRIKTFLYAVVGCCGCG